MVTIVITTCKREAKVVFRAIDSVINQTYKAWELIVVDDSPCEYDQRRLIRDKCEDLSEQYDVTYIANKKNSGACFSRNKGLQVAKGEYIAYLDDDDEWLLDKLDLQQKCLKSASKDVALVYGPLFKVDDETGVKNLESLLLKNGFLFDELMKKGNFVGGMSIPMMRTEIVRLVGGFDELMQSAQDMDLWLRLAENYEIMSIDVPLAICHTHRGEQISKNPEKKIAGIERLIEKNKDYLYKHKDIHWARTRALIPYYLMSEKKDMAFATWLKIVRTCPFKVISNGKELARIVLC